MVALKTIPLLTLSNVFMPFVWYAHLRDLREKPWMTAALISRGIAFFESMVQVPSNRKCYQIFTLAQLKIIQEVITLAVCPAGAVFLIFRR